MAALIILIIWLVSGAFAYAINFGDVQYMWPKPEHYRSNLSFSVYIGLFGVFGLLVSLLFTGFAEHGLKWK